MPSPLGFVIALFAMSSTRTSAEDFIKSINGSGLPDSVAFITGLNVANWCSSCLDVATHLVEEAPSLAQTSQKF